MQFRSQLRLVFPSLQENKNVLTIIPTYLETLDKKIQNAAREQEN